MGDRAGAQLWSTNSMSNVPAKCSDFSAADIRSSPTAAVPVFSGRQLAADDPAKSAEIFRNTRGSVGANAWRTGLGADHLHVHPLKGGARRNLKRSHAGGFEVVFVYAYCLRYTVICAKNEQSGGGLGFWFMLLLISDNRQPSESLQMLNNRGRRPAVWKCRARNRRCK